MLPMVAGRIKYVEAVVLNKNGIILQIYITKTLFHSSGSIDIVHLKWKLEIEVFRSTLFPR